MTIADAIRPAFAAPERSPEVAPWHVYGPPNYTLFFPLTGEERAFAAASDEEAIEHLRREAATYWPPLAPQWESSRDRIAPRLFRRLGEELR
ncbi:MAG TPA: hypothetical protein VKU41_27770 [Polyangiaceae bacterium]|nr:hypothetical protein [Polyangiaceae bacterium]